MNIGRDLKVYVLANLAERCEQIEYLITGNIMQKTSFAAWQKLEPTLFGPIYTEVWDRFYEQFQFRASIKAADWPGIVEPIPSVTYSVQNAFGSGSNEIFYSLFYETNEKFRKAFRACTRQNEKIYALDWHHEAFWFYPHGEMESNTASVADEYERRNFDAWKIPVFPDGDYYIFLAEDFRFGTFGHPWEQTICVFGQQLIDAIELDKPSFFTEIQRKNQSNFVGKSSTRFPRNV